ncbi:hypothetical protein PDJAM_G00220750 [Pangasius djambal]|uniref:Uncharacterized protein n=1 Tax=Pangasius djambal TaxID=1691987 RepID=A0ACC5YC33_9TELE|nr:hypothetical protein [Pangasius djambal]
MAGKVKMSTDLPKGMDRLKEEHRKVVKDCQSQITHWRKLENDYENLQERLSTLPDKLSYDIMVPFGSLAFMPGKLVHTNELTVLLGDNWFTKCSAKQAQTLVEHRKKHVKNKLDDLHQVVKGFQDRAGFTENLEKMACDRDFVDIREEVGKEEAVTKGKHRVAHKPNSKPKEEYVLQLEEEEEEEEANESVDGGNSKGVLTEEELWARLDELERLEEEQDERDRMDSTDTYGEDTTSSSSEEEKEADAGTTVQVNGHDQHRDCAPASHTSQVNGIQPQLDDDEQEEEGEEEGNALPTIYFSHTVEPKKVRINTGKNTTLKFSERKEQKEQAKRKKKNGKCNGHAVHEHHKITTPADIYRVFVDVVNGEPVPRKSILKSRSRENSVMDSTDTYGEDTTSSSSEEEKEADAGTTVQVNGHDQHRDCAPASHTSQVNGIQPQLDDDEQEEEGEEEGNALPTIYFSHTVEPKKVRINTGKNTTLKFSERKEQKEQAKRKKKNGKCNGHAVHEHHKITTPADIYRVFVDVVNGEPVPRKSILKSRSRENSVCSDTSESSTADFEERRAFLNRAHSHDEGTHSDTSDGITEEDSPTGISLHPNGRFEAFSGTVIEKDPLPSMIPHLTITPPALPTILERKQEEVGSEVPQDPPKRVSKFKAARLQQK